MGNTNDPHTGEMSLSEPGATTGGKVGAPPEPPVNTETVYGLTPELGRAYAIKPGENPQVQADVLTWVRFRYKQPEPNMGELVLVHRKNCASICLARWMATPDGTKGFQSVDHEMKVIDTAKNLAFVTHWARIPWPE